MECTGALIVDVVEDRNRAAYMVRPEADTFRTITWQGPCQRNKDGECKPNWQEPLQREGLRPSQTLLRAHVETPAHCRAHRSKTIPQGNGMGSEAATSHRLRQQPCRCWGHPSRADLGERIWIF